MWSPIGRAMGRRPWAASAAAPISSARRGRVSKRTAAKGVRSASRRRSCRAERCDGQITVTGARGSTARPAAIASSSSSSVGCGSVITPTLTSRTDTRRPRLIAHLDIDAFFAAVEMHRRPQLRGRPIVVGGDPNGRGVVATANYAARRFGIRSAMSCAEALRRCPEVVFVPPDIAHYREWSGRVWDLVRELSPAVEVLGLDEGYLELPDEDAGRAADEVRRAVGQEVRLSCSLGVATCKVVAKVASDRDKPGGVTVVPAGEEAAFLAPLPLRALPGVGPRTEQRLKAAGLATVGDLAALDDEALGRLASGRHGEDIRRRARGIDTRPVAPIPAERISISSERTFARDLSSAAELETIGRAMADRVAEALRTRGRAARTVTLKLRYTDFQTITRGQTVTAATDDERVIWETARTLLTRALTERDGPLRLMGVGVSGLTVERQLTLF